MWICNAFLYIYIIYCNSGVRKIKIRLLGFLVNIQEVVSLVDPDITKHYISPLNVK